MRENHENQETERKKRRMTAKDKQAWLGLASACAVVVLAVVLVIVFASKEQPSIDAGNVNSAPPVVDNDSVGGNLGDTQKPVEEDMGMLLPVSTASVSNDFGFFYNQTIDCYYHHEGVDFVAAEGTAVIAVEDGVVESIYTGDILKGTEIVVDHGDGLKTLYRFVTAAEGLAVGDSLKKGDVLATVSEATGDEYKDGAHLHFEIMENGKAIDPTKHLSLAEK